MTPFQTCQTGGSDSINLRCLAGLSTTTRRLIGRKVDDAHRRAVELSISMVGIRGGQCRPSGFDIEAV
jgi:hypothetical protein